MPPYPYELQTHAHTWMPTYVCLHPLVLSFIHLLTHTHATTITQFHQVASLARDGEERPWLLSNAWGRNGIYCYTGSRQGVYVEKCHLLFVLHVPSPHFVLLYCTSLIITITVWRLACQVPPLPKSDNKNNNKQTNRQTNKQAHTNKQ